MIYEPQFVLPNLMPGQLGISYYKYNCITDSELWYCQFIHLAVETQV